MIPNPTPADIEEILLGILRDNRPTSQTKRGKNSHLEVYDEEIQKKIIEPLFAARASAGIIGEIDDLGHDTSFAKAWNRAVRGKPDPWDCRQLAAPFVRASIDRVPNIFEMIYAVATGKGSMDKIDEAILKNLPEILAGPGLQTPTTFDSLRSWVDDSYLNFIMHGPRIELLNEDETPLEEPTPLPPYIDWDESSRNDRPDSKGIAFFGLKDIHDPNERTDEADLAIQAFRKALENVKLDLVCMRETLYGLANRSCNYREKLGLTHMWTGTVSVSAAEDHLIVYRGAVEGLKVLPGATEFMCGPREAFVRFLVAGGFSPSGAESYLDRLAQTDAAFSATMPLGSIERVALDAETLYGLDIDPEGNKHFECDLVDAVPIFAAGRRSMLPEMTSARQRAG